MASTIMRVGDIGTVILLDCRENISTATGCKLKVRKPDGSETEWTATIHGTQYLKHITVAGDLDQAGTYAITGYLTLGVWTGHADPVFARVYGIFEKTA